MTTRLDGPALGQACGASLASLSAAQAARCVGALGWLAPWLLLPEVLEKAAAHQPAYRRYCDRPRLPAAPGGCWVMFARPADLPLLRPAFVLPVCWRHGRDHDPCLPGPLRTLARFVHDQVVGTAGDRWGLFLAVPEGEEPRDLSGLDGDAVGADSGWAALAGGLCLGRDDLSPDPEVWATAAWDAQFGVGRVDPRGVGAKLTLAAEWGVRRLFLPAQNQPELAEWKKEGGRLEVELLAPVARSPHALRLLAAYTEQLGISPTVEAPLRVRHAYYSRLGRSRADGFYWTHFLAEAIERCRGRLRQDHPDCQPTHLVTVVGNQAPVVGMAPAVLEVQRCLLLYEEKKQEDWFKRIEKNRDDVSALLGQRGTEVESVGVRLGERVAELEKITAAVVRFAAGVAPGQLAFDLTPGYKSLSLELEAAAPPGSWLLYCRHKQTGADNRVEPGTERYDCWRR
jgi:hypothetical protein